MYRLQTFKQSAFIIVISVNSLKFSNNYVLRSSFPTYHRSFNRNDTTVATCLAQTAKKSLKKPKG